MPTAQLPEVVEREIWTTPEEFRHGLDLAFPGRVTERSGILRVDDGQAAMEVALEILSPRVIALLNLPRMKVSLRMTAGSVEQRAALLAHMDLAMHRGGG
jgi:hypothetical protein